MAEKMPASCAPRHMAKINQWLPSNISNLSQIIIKHFVEVQSAGGSSGTGKLPVLTRNDIGQRPERDPTVVHREQRADHDPHHVVQKTVGGYREGNEIALTLNVEILDGTRKIPFFAFIQRTERGEIMRSDKRLCFPVQRFDIHLIAVMQRHIL